MGGGEGAGQEGRHRRQSEGVTDPSSQLCLHSITQVMKFYFLVV